MVGALAGEPAGGGWRQDLETEADLHGARPPSLHPHAQEEGQKGRSGGGCQDKHASL